jgi:hypothetical protein
MPNKKIFEDLAELTTSAAADVLPIVDDTTGTPTTKHITVANLMLSAPVQTSDLGTAAATDASDYATAAQGLLADSAIQSSDLGTAATTASTDYATAAQGSTADTAVQPAGIANMVETTDSINVLADVDTITDAPTPDDLLKWNGTNFVPGTVSVDVDTPLNTALRGTDNPHIGAYPNQSFKVTDNPQKSVMVIADADGNLDFVVKTDLAKVYLNTPTQRLALATGFSVQEDGDEPDIEVVTPSGLKYSVISGDSDTKGANGLPTRQGFNYSDIGANPAPILISGGSIA